MIQIFLVDGQTGPPEVVQEVLGDLKRDCTDSRASQKMFFCVAKNRIRNLATVTTAALKTHLRVWIEERYRNLQVKKLGGNMFHLIFKKVKSFQNLSTDAR